VHSRGRETAGNLLPSSTITCIEGGHKNKEFYTDNVPYSGHRPFRMWQELAERRDRLCRLELEGTGGFARARQQSAFYFQIQKSAGNDPSSKPCPSRCSLRNGNYFLNKKHKKKIINNESTK
jgi:hypothetical protein